jgi:Tfp pilus assembly protein PilO
MNDTAPNVNQLHQFSKYYKSIGPMWEKPRNRMYSTVIFSFLAISLFGWYAIKPTIQTILFLRRDIADKISVNQKMEEKIASLIEARANLDEVQSELYLIREAIPQNPDSLDLVLQMKNLINTTSASISSLTIAGVPVVQGETILKGNKGTSSEYTVDILLVGGYQALEKVLQGLNTMRRITTISTLNFALDNKDSGMVNMSEKMLKLSFRLKSYYK